MSAATRTRSSGPNPWRGEVPPDVVLEPVPDDAPPATRRTLLGTIRDRQDRLYRMMAQGADHHEIEQAQRDLDGAHRYESSWGSAHGQRPDPCCPACRQIATQALCHCWDAD